MLFARAALASGIIFPLYIYPGTSCSGWTPPHQRAANPNVKVLEYVPTGFGSPHSLPSKRISQPTRRLVLGLLELRKGKISGATVTLNPGVAAPAAYYGFSDQIVTREDNYNSFSPSQYTTSASTPVAKQAVILHTTGSTLLLAW
ncbi:hypothetical protein B0J17DRAFT_766781 [Rhizoctonia solani]|nr:hypothetical protein B0J17DRAFT_766781 [Rhizoctonia solani]